MRGLYVIGSTYLALSAGALGLGTHCDCVRGPTDGGFYPDDYGMSVTNYPGVRGGEIAPLPVESMDAVSWFQRIRPHCNALEVATAMRNSPPPIGVDGAGYGAACWALAGKIDLARATITELPDADRWRAVGIVFEIGHPIADMGDDLAAGPIMELTVEFWPNHFMALYHAGAANFELGRLPASRDYLRRFMENYHADDGWTASARSMLREMGK